MDGADFGLGGFGPGGLGGLEDAVWNGAGFLKVTGWRKMLNSLKQHPLSKFGETPIHTMASCLSA